MRKWQREDVTAEQMVGQLLQHISLVYERLRLVERAQHAERCQQRQDTGEAVRGEGDA